MALEADDAVHCDHQKHTEPPYHAEGREERTKKRRNVLRRDHVVAEISERPMQRWSLDFMSAQLAYLH